MSGVIYFVRHGETMWNRAGRLQGQADSPLTRRGVGHALAYADYLSGLLASEAEIQLHASPMGRARQTAALIADGLGLDGDVIRVDPLLAEHDVGAWSGRTWPEIEAAHEGSPDLLKDWSHRPPGGETRNEMRARAERWLAARSVAAPVVVVSHGGMSRAFRAAYLGLSSEGARALETHTHGRLFRLAGGRAEELAVEAGAPPPESLLG